MKLLIVSILVCFPITFFAQNKADVYKISYDQYMNDKKTNTTRTVFYQDLIVYFSKPEDKNQQFIDLKNKKSISTILFENQIFKKETPIDSLPRPSIEDDTQFILGYLCKHASFSYFSNKIDVWYTEKSLAKGTPHSSYLPNSNSLVLKMTFNDNQTLIATSIEKVKNYKPTHNFSQNTQLVNSAEFEEIIIKSRYNRLIVFDNEILNFDPNRMLPKESELVADKVYHFSKGSVVMKKIKVTPKMKGSGSIFAKVTCKSNGDAYDRTGSVFVIPAQKDMSKTLLEAYLHGLEKLPVFTDNKGNQYQGIKKEKDYAPPIEIFRFYTSFGVNYFNDKRKINNYKWADDVVYKGDVTSLIPIDEDEIWIGVFIGNYDSGGHMISLELDSYPSHEEKENNTQSKYIEPLFLTVNTLEMSGQNYGGLFSNDTLTVDFEITDNIKNLSLLYTSTGHGGWGGGDEFTPRMNKIYVDGNEVFKIIPWRTDCATYRLSNPASGNFQDGLSSSDLSRSNWCPGTLTSPYIIPLSHLKKGKHRLEVIIEQGSNEGASTNHWNVSGVLIGDIKKEND